MTIIRICSLKYDYYIFLEKCGWDTITTSLGGNNPCSGYSLYYIIFSEYSLFNTIFSGYSLYYIIFSGYSLYYIIFSGYSLYYTIFSGYSLFNTIFSGYSLFNDIFSGYKIRYKAVEEGSKPEELFLQNPEENEPCSIILEVMFSRLS